MWDMKCYNCRYSWQSGDKASICPKCGSSYVDGRNLLASLMQAESYENRKAAKELREEIKKDGDKKRN